MSQNLCKFALGVLSRRQHTIVRCANSSAQAYLSLQGSRHCATAVLSPATPDGHHHKEYSNKIKDLVDQIGGLKLTEVSDLNELLKFTLKISDAPIAMGFSGAAVGPAPAAEEEEDSGKKFVQTEFSVNLVKYDDSKKVAVIKAIKAVMPGMNLVQAKKFVESAPQTLQENISKEDAEKLKQSLHGSGATIEIE